MAHEDGSKYGDDVIPLRDKFAEGNLFNTI